MSITSRASTVFRFLGMVSDSKRVLSMVSAKQRGHFCRTSSAELLARGLIANSEPGSLESSEMALGSSLCPTRPPAVRGVLRRLTEKVQRVAAKG